MPTQNTGETPARRPLRLWPGVAIALLALLVRFGAPLVTADAALPAVIGPIIGAVLILLWWLFFSRAAWGSRR